MWKVERAVLNSAGGPVTTSEDDHFRIKHIVSNKYLSETASGDLKMVDDYQSEEIKTSTFRFKGFVRNNDSASNNTVQISDLTFLLATGSPDVPDRYLTYASAASMQKGQEAQTLVGSARALRGDGRPCKMHGRVELKQLKIAPSSDALMIMPVGRDYLQSVRDVRKHMIRLRVFQQQLALLDADAALPTKTKMTSVLATVDKFYESVQKALSELVLNCSMGQETDPMSKDGIPNIALQKVLRELGAIELCICLVQEPFRRGVDLAAIAAQGRVQAEHRRLVKLIDLLYRLMKQMVKGNETNARLLFEHLSVLRSQLGKGILVTPTLSELFMGKRTLLEAIQPDFVQQIVNLLHLDRGPQYIEFLMQICASPEPIIANQMCVVDLLLVKNKSLLPVTRIKGAVGGGRGAEFEMKIDESQQEWIDLLHFKERAQMGDRNCELADAVLNAPLRNLALPMKYFRFYCRCINLYSKLAKGRNQGALVQLLSHEEWSFENLMCFVKESRLPSLLRGRYIDLISSLYVDRDPQSPKAHVAFTRSRSKLAQVQLASRAESQLIKRKSVINNPNTKVLPVATPEELAELEKVRTYSLFVDAGVGKALFRGRNTTTVQALGLPDASWKFNFCGWYRFLFGEVY